MSRTTFTIYAIIISLICVLSGLKTGLTIGYFTWGNSITCEVCNN